MDKKSRILTVIAFIAFIVYIVANRAVQSSQAQMEASREQAREQAANIASQSQQILESAQNIKVTQYCFRNEDLLNQHYEKHGKEMGFASAAEYEMAASAVITNSKALHKTEAEDGDDVYYIEETNEFVVVSTDGYIRTYFNPSSGKDYFDRQ